MTKLFTRDGVVELTRTVVCECGSAEWEDIDPARYRFVAWVWGPDVWTCRRCGRVQTAVERGE